jgi:hypothetical protein
MRNIFGKLLVVILVICTQYSLFAQDTTIAYFTADKPTIDGKASDHCWSNANWHPLDQVWIGHPPSNPRIFSARYKVSWDTDRLYLLMEVIDTILVNWNPDKPLYNYSSNDCPEIFIDEDNSGGDHETSPQAFAYHISTLYDVIDKDVDGNPKLFNDNITVLRTDSGTTYTWEMAIKVYGKDFVYDSLNTPLSLYVGKVLGFTVAYNDSDTKYNERESMIASAYIAPWKCNELGYPSAGVNCSWQTASVFGKLILKENPLATIGTIGGNKELAFQHKANGIELTNPIANQKYQLIVTDILGKQVLHQPILSEYIDLPSLQKNKLYIITIQNSSGSFTKKIEW